jgi:alkanesulfonate monooxygenase SsuD/methylene tetrahydromethanopterin reductase-like flavin-dependent oxidoreductase (luciferase family)
MLMRFGLFHLMQKRDPTLAPARVYADLLERVRLAEDMGLTHSWLAEHHFTDYCLCPSPLVAAAWLAGQTTRMVFAPGILVLPLYDPVRLAQEFGMVSQMSGGRLELGVGVGYQPYEFRRFGMNLDEAADRSLEMLDILEASFTGASVTHKGRHYAVEEFASAVPPATARSVTYFAGAVRHPTIPRRVVAKGYVPFVYNGWSPFETIVETRAKFDALAREEGVDPRSIGMALERFVYVTDDKAEALWAAEQFRYTARAARSLRFDYVKLDGTTIVDQPAKDDESLETIIANGVIGDAEHCAQRIAEEIRRARLSHYAILIGVGAMDQARVLRSLERIGRDVLPRVREVLGSAR